MQSAEQTSPLVVQHPRHAAAFSHPLRLRILMLCAAQESSLSELQKKLNVPLNRLDYHVRRLLEAGLLLVSRTEPRAGRAIRYYRSAAKSFLVPQDRLPELPSERRSSELRQSLSNELGRGDERHVLYSAGPEGKVLVRLTPQGGSPSARGMELWRLMKLSSKQRALLGRELNQLLERYAGSPQEAGSESYLVHAAFAPAIRTS
jgi:DNA-binding transcriptional ArsR family regulator